MVNQKNQKLVKFYTLPARFNYINCRLMVRPLLVFIPFVTMYYHSSAQFGFGVQGAATYNLRSVSVGSKDYDLNPAPCFGYGVNAFYNVHKGLFRISAEANYVAA